VDCGDLFSTVKGRDIFDECQDYFYKELYDGAMLEMDNFIKLFIHELAETLGGKCMDKTNTNGLSANSQQAKKLLIQISLFSYSPYANKSFPAVESD
jgi:hypothetical protein